MDTILDMDFPTEASIRSHLTAYPNDLNYIYLKMLLSINQREKGSRDRVYNVLRWLLYCQRPLEVIELFNAVFYNYSLDLSREIDHDEMAKIINRSCLHLIVVERTSANILRTNTLLTVRFRHKSAIDFIYNYHSDTSWESRNNADVALRLSEIKDSASSNAYLARSCLACIERHFQSFDANDYQNLPTFEKPSSGFFEYSAIYWIDHSLQANSDLLVDEILTFAQSDNFRLWVRKFMESRTRIDSLKVIAHLDSMIQPRSTPTGPPFW